MKYKFYYFLISFLLLLVSLPSVWGGEGYKANSNSSNVSIPDQGGDYTYVQISGAPSDAKVTKVKYTIRIKHTYRGDLA
ncbi:secreted protein, partial [Candidatus Magnetomorum sp. HK-1]